MFKPPPAAKKNETRASQPAAEQQQPPTLVLQLQAPTEPEQNGVSKTKPSQQASPLPAPDTSTGGTQAKENVNAAQALQAEKMCCAVEKQNASTEEQATTEISPLRQQVSQVAKQLTQEKLEQERLAQELASTKASLSKVQSQGLRNRKDTGSQRKGIAGRIKRGRLAQGRH